CRDASTRIATRRPAAARLLHRDREVIAGPRARHDRCARNFFPLRWPEVMHGSWSSEMTSSISRAAVPLGAAIAACAFAASGANAKVEGDTITLGAAISMTGKYSTNGKNTLDGYEYAIKRINDQGGIKVGGKSYKLAIKYYDDESTSARGAQLME